MPKSASYQPLCSNDDCSAGVLRVHDTEGEWEDRADYHWGCTMRLQGGEAELWGVLVAPAPSDIRAIRKFLVGMGVYKVTYEIEGRIVTRTDNK